MAQVCRQCSRVNPDDATYCYYDGTSLIGHGSSAPVNASRERTWRASLGASFL